MPIIKLNNRSIKDVTSLPFGVGNLIHIQSQTASASSSVSFTLSSTYKEYQFYFINIKGSVGGDPFLINFSTDNGSNYNVTKTSTVFTSRQAEDASDYFLNYDTSRDSAQSTSNSYLVASGGFNTSSSLALCGFMQLFNPSSTTYVKHWISTVIFNSSRPDINNSFSAGYANTTSALTNIRFSADAGTINGTIAMFGVL